MLQSRWLYVFLAVVLVAIAGLTYRAGAATDALADHSYDTVEAARLNRSVAADHSYDTVEAARLNRSVAADHSYDAVEAVRVDRSALLGDVASRLARRDYLEQIKDETPSDAAIARRDFLAQLKDTP